MKPTATVIIKGIFNHQGHATWRPLVRPRAGSQCRRNLGPVYLRLSDGAAIKGMRVNIRPKSGNAEMAAGLAWPAAVDFSPLHNKRLDEKLFEAVKAVDRSRHIHIGSDAMSLPGSRYTVTARTR